jgi:hypothetical protein
VFLGVHWGFDAFAARDVLARETPNADGTTAYKAPVDIRYQTLGPRADRPGQLFPIGGVPLGVGIANDIFTNNLKPTPVALQPSGREKCGDIAPPPKKWLAPSNNQAVLDRKDSGVAMGLKAQNGKLAPESDSMTT